MVSESTRDCQYWRLPVASGVDAPCAHMRIVQQQPLVLAPLPGQLELTGSSMFFWRRNRVFIIVKWCTSTKRREAACSEIEAMAFKSGSQQRGRHAGGGPGCAQSSAAVARTGGNVQQMARPCLLAVGWFLAYIKFAHDFLCVGLPGQSPVSLPVGELAGTAECRRWVLSKGPLLWLQVPALDMGAAIIAVCINMLLHLALRSGCTRTRTRCVDI